MTPEQVSSAAGPAVTPAARSAPPEPDRPPADLARRLRSGVAWSFANSVLSRLGQVVVGVVLARLLSPADFGVFAVALVAYTIVMSVNELGVSLTVVRAAPGEVDRIAPTVTTLSLASSAVFTGACVALAPVLADALGSSRATGSLRVLALAVPVAGLTAVPGALLQREFRQGAKLGADTAAFVVSTGLGIALAATGGGPLALAWSRVAGNAASAVMFYVLVPRVPRPGFDRAVAREALAFGLPLAGSSLLIYGVLNVDYVVVGTTLGPVALGLYVLAFNLSSWPVNAFSTVARSVSMPAFARLLDGSREAAGDAFVRYATLARPLIAVVYGHRWAAAAAPLAWLAWLGVLRVLLELSYDYLVARAAGRTILVIQAAWLCLLIPALVLGARGGGLAGVGFGHVAVAGLVVAPLYLRALVASHVRLSELAAGLVRPAAAGALAAVAAAATAGAVRGGVTALLAGGLVGGAVYLAVTAPLALSYLPASWRRPLAVLGREPT